MLNVSEKFLFLRDFYNTTGPELFCSLHTWRVKVIWPQERTGRARKIFDFSCAQITFKRLHAAASYVSSFWNVRR